MFLLIILFVDVVVGRRGALKHVHVVDIPDDVLVLGGDESSDNNFRCR